MSNEPFDSPELHGLVDALDADMSEYDQGFLAGVESGEDFAQQMICVWLRDQGPIGNAWADQILTGAWRGAPIDSELDLE